MKILANSFYSNKACLFSVSISLILLFTIISCNPRQGGQPTAPSIEFFNFKYIIATKLPDGKIQIPKRNSNGTCSGTVDLPESQIVQWVQNSDLRLLDCTEDFTVNMVTDVNTAEVHGDPVTNRSDIEVRAGRSIAFGSVSDPSDIFIQVIGPLTPGPLLGTADLFFGTNGPTFGSSRGSDTFFEHELDIIDLNNKRLAGFFRFNAMNKNDSSDTKFLIVMEGTYLMDINN